MSYLLQLKERLSGYSVEDVPDETDTNSFVSLNLPEAFLRQIGGSDFLPKGWSYDDWVEFEERAAILEFSGGFSREEAERKTLAYLKL